MSDESSLFVQARNNIEGDKGLTNDQRTNLLTLLESGTILAVACINRTTVQLREVLSRHSAVFQRMDPPSLSSVSVQKPVYRCELKNEMKKVTIKNCELLLDTGNTAVDLLLSWHDAKKFQLEESTLTLEATGYGGDAVLVKLDPQLKLTFRLKDATGSVVERSAGVDVYVKKQEIEEDEMNFAGVKRNLTPSDSPHKRFKREGSASCEPSVPMDPEDDEPVPINDPSPVRHTTVGLANLGNSGAAKLGLRYDSVLKSLVFLAAKEKAEI